MNAPTGHWKIALAGTVALITFSLWVFFGYKVFLLPPLPETCSPEMKREILKYLIDIKADPIYGWSSKWDYENNRWK